MKKLPFEWTTKLVAVSQIKPTPNNFKLKTEDGLKRFSTSIDSYGLAGTVILNCDLTLIDGNSRVEKAKELGIKKIYASIPNKKLTLKQFTEMAAMHDEARAGEVDITRIKSELGTTNTFFKKWGFALPKAALNKLAEMEKNEAVVNPTANRKAPKHLEDIPLRQVSLLFTDEQAEEYILLCESMYSKFKVDNITDFSLVAVKKLKKLLK